MTNIALNKKILENWTNAHEATNGNITDYDSYSGFTYNYWPSSITLDLEKIYSLQSIRFLLWDGLGKGNKNRDSRTYEYRLLTSTNQNDWVVHFDTENNGYNGWQEFEFPEKVSARFIRIHALKNSANSEFHIVQIEAHDSEPPALNTEITNQRIISKSSQIKEIGDGSPISSKIKSITHELESLIEKKIIHPDLLIETISNLQIQVRDVESIEKSLDSVRREIIGPVNKELEKSKKLGKFSVWGFWVGIIGGLVAILSIIISIYINIENKKQGKIIFPNAETITSLKDEYQIELITYAWDRALALHNFNLLRQLYHDVVNYNGLDIKKNNLLEKKSKDFFNKRYYQYIDRNKEITSILKGPHFYEVSVPIIFEGRGQYSTCNLRLEKINSLWKITGEQWK